MKARETGAVDASADLHEARARAKDVVDDLRRELEGIIAGQSDPPDDEHDVEGSSIAFERERVKALLALAESRLAAIDEEVGSPTPGTRRSCEECGGPIGEERVAAVPGTRRCVRCATPSTTRLRRAADRHEARGGPPLRA